MKKVRQDLNEAKIRFGGEGKSTDLAISLSDILTSCSLVLDRCMNAVWTKYNDSRQGKNKPNIYFISSKDESSFNEALTRLWLADLREKNAALYSYLKSRQPWATDEGKILKLFKDLAAARHECDPEITPESKNNLLPNRANEVTFVSHLHLKGSEVLSKTPLVRFNTTTGKSSVFEFEQTFYATFKKDQSDVFVATRKFIELTDQTARRIHLHL